MTPTLANTITADMGLIPGFAFVGPALGLPLSVLAAFLECPFVSLSGVKQGAIWYSLQANFVSLLVGYVGLFAAGLVFGAFGGYRSEEALFLVWPFIAVAVSIAVEQAYLARRQRAYRPQWGWTALGNVLSASACVLVLVLVGGLRAKFPQWGRTLAPYHDALQLLAGFGSAALFLIAFFIRAKCPSQTTANVA